MSRLFPGRASGVVQGVLLGTAVLIAGCGGSDTPATTPVTTPPQLDCACPAMPVQEVGLVASQDLAENQTAVDPLLVMANNNLGLTVLNSLLSQGASGNTAIAPVSLAESLELAYNGAGGTTQQAMAQVLQLDAPGVVQPGGLSVQQLNADNAALQAALYNPDAKVSLLTASALGTDFIGSNPTYDAFNRVNTSYYGADAAVLPPMGTPTEDAQAIDNFISFYTYRQIAAILAAGSYNVTANNILLANSLYIQATWLVPFSPPMTLPATFTNGAGVQTSVTQMGMIASLPYLQGADFQAVSLPYGAGKRLAMLVVLPDAGTDLNTFVAGVTAATVEQWESELQSQEVGLSLPRFTSSYVGSLQNALTSLGMGVAFDSSNANFSGLAAGDYLQDVLHGVVVSVNENGTSVTPPSVTGGQSNGPVAPVQLTVSRPFFYAIRDNQSGELLVIGVVTDPGSG